MNICDQCQKLKWIEKKNVADLELVCSCGGDVRVGWVCPTCNELYFTHEICEKDSIVLDPITHKTFFFNNSIERISANAPRWWDSILGFFK